MPIAISCPYCNEEFEVADQQAGKQVRCPQCDETFRAAAQASSSGNKLLIWGCAGIVGCLALLVVGGGLVAAIVFLWVIPAGTDRGPKNDPAVVAQPKNEIEDKKEDAKPKDNPPKDEAALPKDNGLPAKQEVVNAVALTKGQLRTQSRLDPSDFEDPVMHNSRKLYAIPLQAGRHYVIDLVSQDFDAFLRLEDPTGMEVARDDDSGGNLNARIKYTPSQSGLFRVIATSLGHGEKGSFTLTIREEAPVAEILAGAKTTQDAPNKPPAPTTPVPAETKEPKEAVSVDPTLPVPTSPVLALGENTTAKKDLTITSINLPGDKIVGDLLWSATGDAFFALTKDGILSRVAHKGLIEKKRLNLGQRCDALAMSGEGLLATLPTLQEVWIIDPVSLTVKKRVPAPTVVRTLSAPPLKVALVVDKQGVSVLDLVKGAMVRQVPKCPTLFARVSPDGRYYFAQTEKEELASYRIEGTDLVPHQTSDPVARNGKAICVSPDGKYVCLPSDTGNYGTKFGTFIYQADNLRQPVLTLVTGPYPQMVGFDPAAGLIFAQKAGKQILVYNMSGALVREYSLAQERGITDQPRQFVPHPKGKKLLVLAGKHLLLVELDIG